MEVKDRVVSLRRDAGLTQRQLAELAGVAQSIITAYESGRRRPSPRMLERLRMAARPRPSTTLTAHRSEVLAIAHRHKAVNVRVFGSVARGLDRPGSDIDLLVRFEPDASLFDQVEMTVEIEELLGVPVDVVSESGLRERHNDIRAEAHPL